MSVMQLSWRGSLLLAEVSPGAALMLVVMFLLGLLWVAGIVAFFLRKPPDSR